MTTVPAAVVEKTDSDQAIHWRKNGTATVQIEQWPLHRVLQSLSDQGGWEVFVEPDLQILITTRFNNLSHSEALRRILGDVNFAILPHPGKRSKLLVYKTSSVKAIVRILPTKRLSKLEPDKKEEEESTRIKNELIITIKPGSNIDI